MQSICTGRFPFTQVGLRIVHMQFEFKWQSQKADNRFWRASGNNDMRVIQQLGVGNGDFWLEVPAITHGHRRTDNSSCDTNRVNNDFNRTAPSRL